MKEMSGKKKLAKVANNLNSCQVYDIQVNCPTNLAFFEDYSLGMCKNTIIHTWHF